MANIRINQLPPTNTPSPDDVVPLDNATTRRATVQAIVDAGAPVASQSEAEAGSNNTKRMTPLTTRQAIEAIGDARFASAAQGALADTAVQPADLDLITSDIEGLDTRVQAVEDAADRALKFPEAGTDGTLPAVEDRAQKVLGFDIDGKPIATEIEATELADGSVTRPKIAPGAVGTDELADGSVTDAKLSSRDRYFGPVAGPTRIPTDFSNSLQQIMSRKALTAKTDIDELQLVFPNWSIDSSKDEAQVPGTATITASIEYPEGVFTRVTFSGNSSASVPAGEDAISDAIKVSIPRGALFWVRSFYENSAGVPYDEAPGSNIPGLSGSESGASGIDDKTMGGDVAYSAISYGPTVVLGMTDVPSVAIHGDSRAWGQGDSDDRSGSSGNVQRALADWFPVINMAEQGDSAVAFLTQTNTRRRALANYCTHVFIEYGVNDLRSGGRTAADLQEDIETITAFYPTKKVFVTTLEPETTSTDSWATLVNQTPRAYESERVGYNDAVRMGLAGVAGYVDLADAAESSRNSGLWKVTGRPFGYTTDGLHLTRAGNLLGKQSNLFPIQEMLGVIPPKLEIATLEDMALAASATKIVTPQAAAGELIRFTPRIVGSTTAGTGTYGTATGIAQRVGNLVFLAATFQNVSAHTGTGGIIITDLPYWGGTLITMGFVPTMVGLNWTAGKQLIAVAGTPGVDLYQQGPGDTATRVPISTPISRLTVTGFYFVNT